MFECRIENIIFYFSGVFLNKKNLNGNNIIICVCLKIVYL